MEKRLGTSIFSCSQNVFDPSQNHFQFFVTFIIMFSNAFDFDKSKTLA